MNEKLAKIVKELTLKEFKNNIGNPNLTANDSDAWRRVGETGTRLWLDTGDIDEATKLWNSRFEALTTNNTLLNKEVQKGIYDDLIGGVADEIRKVDASISQNELILEVAFVLNARHGLRLVEAFDAKVSVELHTDLANDIERTVAYGLRFYDICPERFIVKVPLTPSGVLGARKLVQKGIPINFTLGFSARQNYLAAVLTNPAYVNVFMGRLNSFVSSNNLGDGKNIGEKAVLSTQRELIDLRSNGRSKSCLIGASMRDAEQIASLAGVDVFTMPTKVAAQYAENPSQALESQVNVDPDVSAADGMSISDFNGDSLWKVTSEFKTFVDTLGGDENLDSMTAEQLVDNIHGAGFGDLFPKWTNEDVSVVSEDGKIPVYEHWKSRLSSGEIGLDALMNLSALRSFVSDQKALDERIHSFL